MSEKMRETFNFVHLIFFIFIALLISSCVSDETFMNAIVSKDEKRVKQLIEKGADVNGSQSPYKGLIVPTARCTMPLPCAAYAGNINIVKMLVANGADVNKFHKDGSSAINEADNSEETKIFWMLESASASTSSKVWAPGKPNVN